MTVAPAIANEAAEGVSAGADAPTTGSLIGGDIAISHGGGAAIKDLGLAMPNSGAEIEPVANVPQGGGCFAAGMLLSLGDGTAMPIEEFATGGGVKAADQNDPEGPVLVGKVVEVFRHEPQPLMEVEVAGDVIRCTPNHPFYVRGRGFIPAEQLKSGDQLRSSSGGWNAVSSVGCRGDVEPVYNIRVAGLHTYFVRVGASDVLVHNKGGGGGNEDPGVLSHGNVAPVSGDDGSARFINKDIDPEIAAKMFPPGCRMPGVVIAPNGTILGVPEPTEGQRLAREAAGKLVLEAQETDAAKDRRLSEMARGS